MNENEYFELNIFKILDTNQIGYLHSRFRESAGLIPYEYQGSLLSNPLHPLAYSELKDLGLLDEENRITQLTKYLIGLIYTGSLTHSFSGTNYHAQFGVDVEEIASRVRNRREGNKTKLENKRSDQK